MAVARIQLDQWHSGAGSDRCGYRFTKFIIVRDTIVSESQDSACIELGKSITLIADQDVLGVLRSRGLVQVLNRSGEK